VIEAFPATMKKYGHPGTERPPPATVGLPAPLRIPVGLATWTFLLAAWLAWAPFRARTGPPGFQLELILDAETLTHLALLVPFAVVLAAVGEPRTRSGLLRAIWMMALLAVILEGVQWFIDARSLSPYDLSAGWIGGVTAILLTRGLLRAGLPARALIWGLALGLFVSVAVATNTAARRQNEDLRLERWNPRFRVLQANEWGGDRAYDGDVSDARICAGENETRICVTPEATFEERRRLVETAESSQVVSLSAWVRSSSNRQSGPARIVTFSAGPYGRNITLAQSQSNLVLRLRTPRSGPNGVWHQFTLREAVPTDRLTRVEGAFRGGRVLLESAGTSESRRGAFAAPFHGTLFVNGKTRYRAPFVFHGRSLAVGVLVFFCGAGLLAGAGLGLRARVLVPAALVAGAVCLQLLGLFVWGGPAPGWIEHLCVAGAIGCGLALGIWDRVRLAPGPESP
jgi:hypothetical protein